MHRRDFLFASGIAGAEVAASNSFAAAGKPANSHAFKLKYTPHFRMFKISAGDQAVIAAYRDADDFVPQR